MVCCCCTTVCLGVAALLLLVLIVDALRARRRRMSFKGTVSVITGGSSGIGLAVAKDICKLGGRVVLMARRVQVLEAAQKEVKAAVPGAIVTTKACDVSDYAKVQAAVDEIIHEEDQIDVMICSAGMSHCLSIWDSDVPAVERMMRVNVNGCFNCAKAVVGHMKRRGRGRICFVSSAAGQVGIYGYTGYSASKFALRGLAESLQMEVAGDNISVSLAFPPDTDTPMLAQENEHKPALTKEIAGTVSLLQPEQIAAAMVKGISAGSFFINFDMLGNLLGYLTCGFAPITGIMNNIAALVLMPIGRIIAIVLLQQWYGLAAKGSKAKSD